jgi:hypothetical protein
MFMKSKSSTSPGNQLPEASNSSAMRLPYFEGQKYLSLASPSSDVV